MRALRRRVALAAAERFERGGAWWHAAMALPAALYGRASRARIAARAREAQAVGVPVISVGALSVGGVGKTPVTRAIVERLRARALRPGVVVHAVAWDEEGLFRRWLGDGAIVRRGRTREAAARAAVAAGADVIVLDDGFQYTRLARALDVVCVDPLDPLEAERVLPAGRLREPAEGIARAGLLVTVVPAGVEEPRAQAARVARAVERLWSRPEPGVVVLAMRAERPAGLAAGAPVRLCTGVARPERVVAAVKRAGLDLRGLDLLADHEDLEAREAEAIARRMSESAGAPALIVTEKDACRPGIAALVRAGWAKVIVQRLEVAWGEDALERCIARAVAGSGRKLEPWESC